MNPGSCQLHRRDQRYCLRHSCFLPSLAQRCHVFATASVADHEFVRALIDAYLEVLEDAACRLAHCIACLLQLGKYLCSSTCMARLAVPHSKIKVYIK
jgi:hypothetical protein